MDANDPRHGTYAGPRAHQADGEKNCYACRIAQAAYEDNRRRQIAYGRWNPWADAEPAREHVRELMAGGTSLKRIAANAGADVSRVSYLLYGRGDKKPPAKIRHDYSEALLAVRPDHGRIPIFRVSRRLAGLIALGYTQPFLAAELGFTQGRVWSFLRHRQSYVDVRTFEKVDALYRRLSMTLPPARTKAEKYAASRARDTARRNKYRPPLAWPGDSIDDPKAHPSGYGKQKGRGADDYDEAVVVRILDLEPIRATAAEKAEAVRRWVASGRSARQLALAHGWNDGRYGKGRDVA